MLNTERQDFFRSCILENKRHVNLTLYNDVQYVGSDRRFLNYILRGPVPWKLGIYET